MIARILFGLICAAALGVSQFGAHAQSNWRELVAGEDWMHYFTVLTMHGEAWGAATEPTLNEAIGRAMASCKAMSGPMLGCGAHSTTIRAGWSLGIRCGHENIIVADRDLVEAERLALQRESELRIKYMRDMPQCVRVVTVDPSGRVVPPQQPFENTADAMTAR
jgi:hypothetical protein